MTFAYDTSYLAGPGNQSIADLKPRDTPATPIITLPSPTTPRRVRVTAVMSTRSDGSEITTYSVEAIPDAVEQTKTAASPPLLGCRRSRSHSQWSLRSEELSPRTPSSSILGSPSLSPVTPPAVPRIGCLPSPKLGDEHGVFPYPEWATYGSDSSCSKRNSYAHAFEPFADDEEPHYHLPSNLLSPELEMSEVEFKKSVRQWTERRRNSRAYRD